MILFITFIRIYIAFKYLKPILWLQSYNNNRPSDIFFNLFEYLKANK